MSEILQRYRKFIREYVGGDENYKNRGLGVMSTIERQFLLKEKAIVTDGENDAIAINDYYSRSPKGDYERLPEGISEYEATKLAGAKGHALCGIPTKYNEWLQRYAQQ